MTIITNVDIHPVNDLRDALLARLPGLIQHMVMYGSYARGEAVPGSDIDVLVIVEKDSPSVIEQARAARYEVMAKHHYQPLLSLLLLSNEDWQELSKHSAGLKHNIENEGITIWSKA